MNRIKKLNGLINQANAEEDHRVYLNYVWSERAAKKQARKQQKSARRRNRKNK